MVTKAEQILEQLRELTPAERLRVVERVIREVAAEIARPRFGPADSIWSDETDADFDAFRNQVLGLRSADIWPSGDKPSRG